MSNVADKLVVFVDANIALHYKRLDQINWSDVTDHTIIEVIVCPILLRELENAKSLNPSKKIRHRAGEYASWLLGRLDQPSIAKGVSVAFYPGEPRISFDEHQLDPRIADDRLIACVIEYSVTNADQPICVLTMDSGLTVKLRLRGMTVKSLPDAYRLAETDAEEQELKRVKDRLAQYENRQPKLLLTFGDGKAFYLVERKPFDAAEFIAAGLSKIKDKHPLFSIETNDDLLMRGAGQIETAAAIKSGFDFTKYENKQKAERNDDLFRFYSEYEMYLSSLAAYYKRLEAVIPLALFLTNENGSAPANHIDVIVKCEDEMFFRETAKPVKCPKEPLPPDRTNSSFVTAPFFNPLFQKTMADVLRDNAPDRDRLDVSEHSAKFTIYHLKHKQRTNLVKIFLDFGSIEKIRNVSLSYEIHAPEIIEPVKGELHLCFD